MWQSRLLWALMRQQLPASPPNVPSSCCGDGGLESAAESQTLFHACAVLCCSLCDVLCRKQTLIAPAFMHDVILNTWQACGRTTSHPPHGDDTCFMSEYSLVMSLHSLAAEWYNILAVFRAAILGPFIIRRNTKGTQALIDPWLAVHVEVQSSIVWLGSSVWSSFCHEGGVAVSRQKG